MHGVTGDYPLYGIPDHIENWATAAAGMGAVIALAFCIRHALRHRSPLALYLFVGAAVSILVEPFPDVLGKAVFAEVGRIPWTGGLGRQIPMYIGLTYMFYLAPAYVTLLDAFRTGISAQRLFSVYGTLVAGACLFELIPLRYDLWQYYGSQGIQLGEMPIWWGFINVHGVLATAVGLHFLLRLLPASRQFLIVPLMPPLFLATHTAGAVFGYLTVGTTNNTTTTTIGTLATVALCLALVRLYAALVCKPAATTAKPAAGALSRPVEAT